jgi:hypothetical protein
MIAQAQAGVFQSVLSKIIPDQKLNNKYLNKYFN